MTALRLSRRDALRNVPRPDGGGTRYVSWGATLLSGEAVGCDAYEERDHDLVDNPRVRAHPVPHLRQQYLTASTEQKNQDRRQCEEQQRKQEEWKEMPPRVAVVREV